jgi:hypothetical protein
MATHSFGQRVLGRVRDSLLLVEATLSSCMSTPSACAIAIRVQVVATLDRQVR